MTATVSTLTPLRSPLHTYGRQALHVRVTQVDSTVGEEWTITGLPVYCALVGYYTSLTAGNGGFLLRPELGTDAAFVFGAQGGQSRARYRRWVQQVNATSGVTLYLPDGRLVGRSGLTRNLSSETLVTDLVFADTVPNAQRGPEVNGDWEIGTPSTYSVAVRSNFTLQDTAANATANTPLTGVPVSGAQAIELWLEISDSGGGSVDPSDLRVRWEHRRVVGSGQWAPVLWEDVASATVGSGVATVPTGIYEVQDTLGSLTLPADLPFTRHYVLPVRNWSGEVRAVVYNNGAVADGTSVNAYMIIRGA